MHGHPFYVDGESKVVQSLRFPCVDSEVSMVIAGFKHAGGFWATTVNGEDVFTPWPPAAIFVSQDDSSAIDFALEGR